MKFALVGLAAVVSMGLMLLAAMNQAGGMSYYLTVSEFDGMPGNGSDGYRVNGKVVEGSIVREPSGQDVRFLMSDGHAELAVRYHGIIPDTFVDGADVVVEGRRAEDGAFAAHTLLAKCPSKYEAADGADEAPAGETY